MDLIERYKRNSCFNKNCRIKCIYDALNCAGYPVRMDCATILSFESYINSYIMNNNGKLSFIGATSFLPYFDIHAVELFGVKVHSLSYDETSSVVNLKRMLDSNMLIILYFDTAELLKKYSENTVRHNVLTSGIVLDANVDANTITFNSLASNKLEMNVFDFASVQQARNSEIIPFKPKYKAFAIELNDFETKDIDFEGIVHNHFIKMGNTYMNGGICKYEDDNDNVFHIGKSAYEQLYDYFYKLSSTISSSKQDKKLLRKIVYIVMQVFIRTLVGSTKTFFRYEFGQAVKSFGTYYGNSNYVEVSEQILAVSKEWKRFICFLNSKVKSTGDNAKLIQELVNQLKKIQMQEEDIMKAFID